MKHQNYPSHTNLGHVHRNFPTCKKVVKNKNRYEKFSKVCALSNGGKHEFVSFLDLSRKTWSYGILKTDFLI